MDRYPFSRILGIVSVILICVSCGNEINLFPDEIPSAYMVYGILDANSEDQFVKIRKTFGGNSDIEELTGNNDLFNPPEYLSVEIEEWSDESSMIYPMTRNSLLKDPGLFADDINVIYHGSFLPEKTHRYNLLIKDPESGLVINASTQVVAPPNVRFPIVDHVKYRFSDTLNHFYVKYEPTGSVHMQQFFINYIEILHSGDTLFQTVCFNVRPRFKEPGRPVVTYTRTYSKNYVLNIMHMLIKEKESVAERQLHSFDFFVWAGDEHLKNYLQLSEKFNDNRRQFFSNIEGGLGIFAACSHVGLEGIWPLKYFYDTIANSSKISNLSFSNKRYSGEFMNGTRPFPILNGDVTAFPDEEDRY